MSSLSFDNVFPGESGQRTDTVAPFSPAQNSRLSASWADPLPAAVAHGRTTGDASSWALSSMRRALDFLFAALALITFLPLMAFAGLLVRFGSPGPVFFRQKRMGRNGREFTLYKFRSMSTRAGNANGSCITVTGDSRITPVGNLLRRY